MTHVMIDTETWGVAPGSAIRSIGAVIFDPETGEIGNCFYANISDESCIAAGLTRDPVTVAWWSDPERAEAQAHLLINPVPLADALTSFRFFYETGHCDAVWSFGANADIPWLEAAFAAVGKAHPWHYRAPRCARTVLALAGVEVDRTKGTHHNALDDARNQAAAIHEAYVRLGLVATTNDGAARWAGNVLRDACHGASKAAGWWDGVDPWGKGVFPTKLMLSVSELAEAMEGDRKNLADDHLPHREMAEVELADAVIRIADLAGSRGYDLGGAIAEKMAYNAKRADHKPEARAAVGGKAY